jgi:flagellar biosynthesis/type III secretory pathway M-ring protein FliF/YscJ
MATQEQGRGGAEEAHGGQVNVTNAPITEDERAETRAEESNLNQPFPWLAGAAVIALVVMAVVAALTAGAQYAIPFVVIAVLAAIFLAVHRTMGRMKTRRYDSESRPAQDVAAEDGSDPVPHLGFDQESSLGDNAQLSDEEQMSHADMNKSTGERADS